MLDTLTYGIFCRRINISTENVKEAEEILFSCGACYREQLLQIAKKTIANTLVAESIIDSIQELFKSEGMKDWYSSPNTLYNSIITEYLERKDIITRWRETGKTFQKVMKAIIGNGEDFASDAQETIEHYKYLNS